MFTAASATRLELLAGSERAGSAALPAERASGIAESFAEARDAFEVAWRAFLARRTEADFDDNHDRNVVLEVDGSPISTPRTRRHDGQVQLYAFDILTLDGKDLLLSLRKTNLARLLARRPDGIFVTPFEQGGIKR